MKKKGKVGMTIVFKVNLKIFQNMNKENNAHLKVELPMKDNGTANKDMDTEYKFGLMVLNMKDIGRMMKHMALEFLKVVLLEIVMRVTGREICNMEKENL